MRSREVGDVRLVLALVKALLWVDAAYCDPHDFRGFKRGLQSSLICAELNALHPYPRLTSSVTLDHLSIRKAPFREGSTGAP